MHKVYTTLFAVFITAIVNAQIVTIYSQDFGDANNLVFPTGWLSTDSGWYVDNTNISEGYANASGQSNMSIKNTSPTGTYFLTSNEIETTGYEMIRVLWGRRISNNYTTFSSIPIFEYSIDGGSNWVNIAYYDTFIDNSWGFANTGDDIMIPSEADNKPSVKFRWSEDITNNPEGTYRFDDFVIKAKIKQTGVGIKNINTPFQLNVFQNNIYVNNNSNSDCTFSVYDLQGCNTLNTIISSNIQYISLNDLNSGIYIIQIQNNRGVLTRKISINK